MWVLYRARFTSDKLLPLTFRRNKKCHIASLEKKKKNIHPKLSCSPRSSTTCFVFTIQQHYYVQETKHKRNSCTQTQTVARKDQGEKLHAPSLSQTISILQISHFCCRRGRGLPTAAGDSRCRGTALILNVDPKHANDCHENDQHECANQPRQRAHVGVQRILGPFPPGDLAP